MNAYEVKAREHFMNGCNCAQAVLLAFAGEGGLDAETAMKLASAFGGGMGRMREVCGALSGAFMAAGLFGGGYDMNDAEAKAAYYGRIRGMGEEFRAEFGSLLCRELFTETLDELKRPCADYVGFAARSLAESLQKQFFQEMSGQ